MRLICAWCQEELPGSTPSEEISHGICEGCEKIYFPEQEAGPEEAEWTETQDSSPSQQESA
jgi:hypothetical protein